MKIGDIVSVSSVMRKNKSRGMVTWHEVATAKRNLLFLGWVLLHEGHIEREEEYTSFTSKRTIKVAVLQPIVGTQYRKPIYALPEAVQR